MFDGCVCDAGDADERCAHASEPQHHGGLRATHEQLIAYQQTQPNRSKRFNVEI